MGAISIREFNANVSKALAMVEGGATLDITKNGRVIAELRPKQTHWLDDPERRAAYDALAASLSVGITGLIGPASYEDRTAR